MARLLTKHEIDRLYEFVEVKEIPYYDVQSEIVDHLASMMEDRWAMGSQLSMERMFLEVYKDFGEQAWRQLWVTRQKAVWKKVGHEAIEFIWKLCSWPGILALILPMLLLYQMLEHFPMAFSWLNYLVLIFVGSVLLWIGVLFYRNPGKRNYLSSQVYMQIFAFEVWMGGIILTLLISKAQEAS